MNYMRPFVAYLLLFTVVAFVVCPAQVWANSADMKMSENVDQPVAEQVEVMGPVVEESTAENSSRKKKYFSGPDACLTALKNGTAIFYTPSRLDAHTPVGNGERKLKLESDACVRMYTVVGWRWVAQEEDTEMVFKGSVINRRFDCGNSITDIRYPESEPEPEAPQAPVKPVIPPCPEGFTPDAKNPRLCLKTVPGEPPPAVDNTCKPTAIRELLSYHEERKGFMVAEIVRQNLPDKADLVLPLIGGGQEKATSIIVLTDGCNVGVKTRNVIRKGDKWKWLWIGLAAGGGFAAGYFLRPGCKKCKTTTSEPIKTTPRSGSPVPIRRRIIPL